MTDQDELPDDEADRRAREAIRRSFKMPYKPQKAIVGKTGRPSSPKRATSKTAEKAK